MGSEKGRENINWKDKKLSPLKALAGVLYKLGAHNKSVLWARAEKYWPKVSKVFFGRAYSLEQTQTYVEVDQHRVLTAQKLLQRGHKVCFEKTHEYNLTEMDKVCKAIGKRNPFRKSEDLSMEKRMKRVEDILQDQIEERAELDEAFDED